MGLGQSVRLASVRCLTLPSRRKDSRRIIHGGELRLATVSMYMAIKAAQIGIKIKIKVHIYMATYLCQKTRESSIEAIQRTIARSKFRLARNGIPLDRIAVLLRSPEEYRAHLEEAFARADIPAHFARGAVRPDPAGRAFYSLLKCAAEGLSARRFAEYLSLAQVPDAGVGGQPPEATARGDRWGIPDLELVPQF